jgi:PKD repeat protein
MLLFAWTTFAQSGITFSSSFSVVCVDMENDIRDDKEVPIEQLSPSTCFKVFENKTVTYSLTGNLGINYTVSWQVVGGTINGSNTGTGASVNINWGATGIGSLSFTYTNTTTSLNKTLCYEKIVNPIADFDVLPISRDGIIYGCVDGNMYFTNLSTTNNGPGLYNYLWSFGDGTFSSEIHPMKVYNQEGQYNVKLIVTNSCGCSSTIERKVIIGPRRTIEISCPNIVCENQVTNYSIEPEGECIRREDWSIIGGQITSNNGNNIEVIWNQVDNLGFGYLTFTPNRDCTEYRCLNPITIRVPVIKNSIEIQGPASLCVGSQGRFFIPQWPSTDVQWEVIGNDPTSPVTELFVTDQRNEIVLEALAVGSYTLRAVYQNTLINCGGIGTINFDVTSANTFTGLDVVCTNQGVTYTSDEGSLNWTLLNANNQVITSISNQVYFNYLFTTPGTYTIKTAGTPECAGSSKNITVVASPSPQNITGLLTVCNGVNYTYTIGTPQANMQYTWAVSGGTFSGSNVGNQVNVTFTGNTSYLQVIKSSSNPIYCTATPVNITTNKTTINAAISAANANVCANSTATYQAIMNGSSPETAYTAGDTYIWSIVPSSAGSITTGQNTPNVSVQWTNYNGGTANLRLVVGKCNTTAPFDKPIIVKGLPTISINTTNTMVCAGTPISFSLAPATLTTGTVVWKVNGVESTQTGISFNHTFTNFSNSNLSFVVTAQLTNPNGCIGTTNIATYTITVKPQPTATLSYAAGGFNSFCLQPEINTVFTAATTAGATIQWYHTNLNGVTTAINPPFPTATQFGSYYFIATRNLCTTTSNILHVFKNCGLPPLPCVLTPTPVVTNISNNLCPAPATTTTPACIDCTTIALRGTTSTAPLLHSKRFMVYGPGYSSHNIPATTSGNNHTASINVNSVGEYQTFFRAFYLCNGQLTFNDKRKDLTIPYLANFDFKVTCNKLEVQDRSTFMTNGITNTTYRYEYKLSTATTWTPAITTANGTIHNSLANGTYQVRLTIQARYNNILYPACQITKNVTISTIPALSINVLNNIDCHDTAVRFGITGTTSEDFSYFWTFETVGGVPVTSTLKNPIRVFSTSGLKTITCVITNGSGCTRTISRSITIPTRCYNGTLTTTPSPATACVGSSILLKYQPNSDNCTTGSTYTWMNESTVVATTTIPQLNVTTTGIYWVRLTSTNGCVYYTNSVVPVFRPLPSIVLNSTGTLCAGSEAKVLVTTNGVITAWSINNVTQPLPPANTPELVLPTTLAAGTYTISVTVTLNGCIATSNTTVVINPAPTQPVINIRHC